MTWGKEVLEFRDLTDVNFWPSLCSFMGLELISALIALLKISDLIALPYTILVMSLIILVSCSVMSNWEPMDSSLLGSPVNGILQARILDRVAIPFSRGSSLPRNWTQVSWTAREGNGTPLQYSCLENPMDGGAWKAAVHGVTEGRTRLSDFTFTFHFHALEKEMATHSTVLAWRIPGTGEPSGLPSMGSHRVGHDWSDLVAAAAAPELQADSLLSESPCYFSHVFYPPCTSPTLITIPEFPLPGGA